MHHCPHCHKPLGFHAWLAMNIANTAICPHCGQRYAWSASGPGLLFMIGLVVAGTWGLVHFAAELGLAGALGAIAALIAVSGFVAVRSMSTVAR
jgi:uncharacterized protein (DUF983 family)